MDTNQQIIEQTKKWITDVVIGCNLCPFAANVVNRNTVHYQVEDELAADAWKDKLLNEFLRLDNDPGIETSFLIFSSAFKNFEDYLDMLSAAENLLRKKNYEGIYQLASFHPDYLFANSTEDDPANFTNRSIYPMLHLLREESIDRALNSYKHPEKIPENNQRFTREKGLTYMKMLRDACL